MGVTDYFYEYKTQDEKNRIIALIEAYRQAFNKLHAVVDEVETIERFIIESSNEWCKKNPDADYWSNQDEWCPSLDDIKQKFPELRLEHIDYEYTAIVGLKIKANCYIDKYSDIVLKDGRRGISVFMFYSAWDTFGEYMDDNDISYIDVSVTDATTNKEYNAGNIDVYGNEIDPDTQTIKSRWPILID